MTKIFLSLRTLTLCLAVLLLAATQVFAHAVLLDSTPPAGSVTAGPTITVRLHFNSRVDPKRSRLSLLLPNGHVEQLDIAGQVQPDTLLAPARDLTAGTYMIRWQVLAADGHITRGEVPFHVK